ncbi:DUF2267 domain-containing protein [Natronomonas sp.]|uniref:DUF2267 domain-containing protein n=1 Tax=Natronomonas sp. TaxID=2184060 RepID=UPI002FC2A270
MEYSEFTGEVQHRLELGTQGEAVRATRAVLSAIGERLQEGEATDLAAPLPMEIDYYLLDADHGQRFDYDEFVSRVADRAEVDEGDAAFYAQAIIDLLADVVPGGEIDDLQAQLPDDYEDLFEIAEGEATPWE